MAHTFYDMYRSQCVKCNQAIVAMKLEVICESCKKKNNIFKAFGWTAAGCISIISPSLGSVAAGVMNSLETNLLGNPNEKKIYDLSTQLEKSNRDIKTRNSELLSLQEYVRHLENSNNELHRLVRQNQLMSDLYIASSSRLLLQIAANHKHYGVIRLERVNVSTVFEYLDWPLFIDFFVPDLEGKGLLHGGIPIDVISPMIARLKMRKPMLYSYTNKEIDRPVDRLR